MEILDLDEAAKLLKMNSEVLRRKAKLGEVPGRKAGKCWIFVDEHLADWVSGRYPQKNINQQSEGITQCQSTSVKTLGGYSTPRRMDVEYSKLLGLR